MRRLTIPLLSDPPLDVTIDVFADQPGLRAEVLRALAKELRACGARVSLDGADASGPGAGVRVVLREGSRRIELRAPAGSRRVPRPAGIAVLVTGPGQSADAWRNLAGIDALDSTVVLEWPADGSAHGSVAEFAAALTSPVFPMGRYLLLPRRLRATRTHRQHRLLGGAATVLRPLSRPAASAYVLSESARRLVDVVAAPSGSALTALTVGRRIRPDDTVRDVVEFRGGRPGRRIVSLDGETPLVVKVGLLSDAALRDEARMLRHVGPMIGHRITVPSVVDVSQLFGRVAVVTERIAFRSDLRLPEVAWLCAAFQRQDPPIIHGDLTPWNIGRARSGQFVVVDFEAARVGRDRFQDLLHYLLARWFIMRRMSKRRLLRHIERAPALLTAAWLRHGGLPADALDMAACLASLQSMTHSTEWPRVAAARVLADLCPGGAPRPPAALAPPVGQRDISLTE